jgi:hypothetical protein
MQVVVEFLGRTRVFSNGREVTLTRQSASFLAYLALFREVDHPREVLIEQFWSSCEPARGRSCLGTALSRLRKTLQVDGTNWLELSPRGAPRISPLVPIRFDIVEFEAGIIPALAVVDSKLEPALLDRLNAGLAQYRGDLLLGWYDNWVLTERERLRLLCLRGYRRLMEHRAATGGGCRAGVRDRYEHVFDESGKPANVKAGIGYGMHADDTVVLGRSMSVRMSSVWFASAVGGEQCRASRPGNAEPRTASRLGAVGRAKQARVGRTRAE